MNRFAVLSLAVLGACAASPEIEDPADDAFYTDDAKADSFGVEDWSPDGAAVLKLVSTASEDMLHDEVGLSARVASGIVTQRETLAGKKFGDLSELDAAKYVGKKVFAQLLTYVHDHHLFKTSLRIPLLVEDENGENRTLLAGKYNAQAKAAGVTGFARYTFVDGDTDLSAKLDSYNERLEVLAEKSNTEITDTLLEYAYSLADYEVGSSKICFIGDPLEAADVVSGQAGVLTGEMYSVWGWRYQDHKTVDDNIESADDDFADTEWAAWSKTSPDVLVIYTNDDDGTHISSDIVPPCR